MTRDRTTLPPDLLDQVPEKVREVCLALAREGHEAFLVGGAVRDLFLQGDPSGDWDVATSARPEEVMRVFPRTAPTGIKHGTVTVIMGENETYQVTTFRGESGYSDGRHPDEVTFLGDIEGDLARRDFTMNALALDPGDGTLIDLHGGREAIENGLLEAVGDPRERFGEDGLRPLRAARFVAVLELSPAGGIEEAMEASREVFARVSAERKRDEIVKMMKAREPSRGWAMLERAGYVPLIFPGLESTVECEQGGRHTRDVWTHSLLCMDACDRRKPLLRLAGLLHDAGKPECAQPREPAEDGMHFYRHEQAGARKVEAWLSDLHFSNEDVDRVASLVEHHMVIYTPEWTDAAIRRFIGRCGRDLVLDVVDLAMADVKTQGLSDDLVDLAVEMKRRVRSELDRGSALDRSDLNVGGSDLMDHLGLAPGPRVGEILAALLDRVVEDPSLNDRDTLLELASKLKEDE